MKHQAVSPAQRVQLALTRQTMDNPDIEFCLNELKGAIESLDLEQTLEQAVLKAAKRSLVKNWNASNPEEDQIGEEEVSFLLESFNEE